MVLSRHLSFTLKTAPDAPSSISRIGALLFCRPQILARQVASAGSHWLYRADICKGHADTLGFGSDGHAIKSVVAWTLCFCRQGGTVLCGMHLAGAWPAREQLWSRKRHTKACRPHGAQRQNLSPSWGMIPGSESFSAGMTLHGSTCSVMGGF